MEAGLWGVQVAGDEGLLAMGSDCEPDLWTIGVLTDPEDTAVTFALIVRGRGSLGKGPWV